ncbi:MAG: AMP-binding protein, partial [Alistipes sp.]|nr:AMP-binding protein [Candidatus Minthomonas equi]
MNFIDLFKKSVAEYSQRTALVDRNGERSTTYAELDRLSSLVAGKLKSLGFGRGDFILVNMGRRMEYIASYLGILKLGGVVVPVVPDYPDDRISFICNDCGSRLTITSDFLSDLEKYEAFEVPAGTDKAEQDSAPALLAYTSGSTGTPKGILFSTADLARGALRHRAVFDGIEPVIYAGMALFSFLLQIIEYHTVLSIGGTTHILEDDVRKSAVSMAAYYKEHGITVGIITPQMLRLYRNADSALQLIITCGERLSRVAPENYRLLNGYGMSETAAFVTTFPVDRAYDNTPVGKSMDGVEVKVLDEAGNPVPDGTEGEICALGEFDTVYFKDSEKTARTMRRMPDGRTLVRTGDIGYVNGDGDIVFSNRKDWMVKVNGQRVETLEIESRLLDMPQIENAAVKAFEDADSQNYLVAYYVEKQPMDEAALRGELSRTLPEYMIPRFLVRMDSLPRNANGKLDRLALTPPAADRYKAEYLAPADALEKAVCDAFEDVLRCGVTGTADDFFALGGDSIKVLRLLERVDGYGLTPDMIFKARTPKAIAALCQASRMKRITHGATVPGFCPLSDSQLGVYLDCSSDPASVKYNIPVLCHLPAQTDIGRFISALKTVAGSHKALNVSVTEQGGVPGMRFVGREITVSEMETEDVEETVRTLVKPFDLSHGPLYRFLLLHCPKGDSFFFDIHHIVFDGTSITAFLEQIALVYEGGECPQETLDIFDIASAEVSLKDTEEYRKAQDFFRIRFDGMECDSTPVPDRITEEEIQGAGHVKLVGEGIAPADVEHFTRMHGITENSLFLGAFAYALAKLNGAQESYFCTVDNGRHDHRLSGSVGMFVRTLPLYSPVDENLKVGEYLAGVQKMIFDTMANDCMSFGELAAEYGLGMSVSFVYQAEMFTGPKMAGDVLEVTKLETSDIQSDIHFMLYKTDGGYTLDVGYRRKLYTEGFVERFAAMYLNVVRGMLRVDTLSDVELADTAARETIRTFNLTELPYEENTTVVDLFRAQAAQTPDGLCLVYEDKKFSYAEVDRITDALAGRLMASGMTHGSVVGILIPRCEYMLLASLGVLKAGCAYLPLDPTYPEDRLNLMVSDSGARMLITTPELSGVISDEFKGERLMTDNICHSPQASVELPVLKPDDLFIILYTSGATGLPKG